MPKKITDDLLFDDSDESDSESGSESLSDSESGSAESLSDSDSSESGSADYSEDSESSSGSEDSGSESDSDDEDDSELDALRRKRRSAVKRIHSCRRNKDYLDESAMYEVARTYIPEVVHQLRSMSRSSLNRLVEPPRFVSMSINELLDALKSFCSRAPPANCAFELGMTHPSLRYSTTTGKIQHPSPSESAYVVVAEVKDESLQAYIVDDDSDHMKLSNLQDVSRRRSVMVYTHALSYLQSGEETIKTASQSMVSWRPPGVLLCPTPCDGESGVPSQLGWWTRMSRLHGLGDLTLASISHLMVPSYCTSLKEIVDPMQQCLRWWNEGHGQTCNLYVTASSLPTVGELSTVRLDGDGVNPTVKLCDPHLHSHILWETRASTVPPRGGRLGLGIVRRLRGDVEALASSLSSSKSSKLASTKKPGAKGVKGAKGAKGARSSVKKKKASSSSSKSVGSHAQAQQA